MREGAVAPQYCKLQQRWNIDKISLKVPQTSPTGQTFKLYVPIEAYGQAAEQARDLSPDDAVLVEGRLTWQSDVTKDGTKKSGLAVLARAVRVMQAAEVSV
jgi:hypothetical protein